MSYVLNKDAISTLILLTIIAFVYVYPYAAYAQTPGPQQSADTTPPTIITPNDPVVAEATGPQGAIVNFDVSATDEVSDNIIPRCIPSSGSTFRIGETTVNCTAIDGAENQGKKSFTVMVQDTIPPTTDLETAKVSWKGPIENQEGTISDDIGFKFDGADQVGIRGFECKIDNRNWQASPVEYQPNEGGCYYLNLGQGSHTFQVRAVDTSNNKDPTPETFTWTIASLRDSITDLKDFIVPLGLPSNVQQELINSLDNAIGNINDNNSYDRLICEYIDSFNYRFSEVMVLDFITEDIVNSITTTSAAIRDRTGCNSPVVDTRNEETVNEGTRNIILDGSNSFDSKDGKSLTYQWVQLSGSPVNIIDSNQPKASFDAPLLQGTNNQTMTFRLTVTDRNELSSDKTVQVTINKMNGSPVAESQTITTASNTPTDITLKATDPDGNALTYAIVSDPESGEISGLDEDTGKLVYTPAEGFTGQDRFTFKANDGTADSNTGHVRVTVNDNQDQDPSQGNRIDTNLQEDPRISENTTSENTTSEND
ncbi:MAG: HYR domain-containing protein [Nitrosopumilus sp.]|nr:HYR domain-containing protein [Nitrosopumilus sp.]